MDQNLPDDDYVLIDEAAWFTVRNLSVRITTNPYPNTELRIFVYKKGEEDLQELSMLSRPFPEE